MRDGENNSEPLENQIGFESYGVKIGVRSNRSSYLRHVVECLYETLPNGCEFIEPDECRFFIDLKISENDGFEICEAGETTLRTRNEEEFKDLIQSRIRLTVAEYACGKVFIHAGVVGWKGRAIVIPAASFAGKTTLVAELIKNGAEYYSDEYAVLDENGLVYPFPKMLSLRGIVNDFTQVERSAESIGAATGGKRVEIAMVLICKYDKASDNETKFIPEILTPGVGMLEILAHTIPIRFNPEFVLSVLNKITTCAIIAKSQRGEAEVFARHLLKCLNGYC